MSVAVHDVLGRRVALLLDGPLGAGEHALALKVSGLPAGVYVVRVACVSQPARRRRRSNSRSCADGLAGDAPDPFALHQVIAFGYEEEGAVTTLLVYDPNVPGRTRHLRAWTADGRAHVATDLPTGPKPRGGYHVHRTPGRLAMLFVVETEVG